MKHPREDHFGSSRGFILAFSIEHWGLHIRLSLKILSVLGRNPLTVLMVAMLCSWFISMWISNTATTMMLLAAVLAIVNRVETDSEQTDPRAVTKFNAALMLGLAYSATIGGMATIIGTPTNLIFSGFYEKNYPNEPGISFAGWLTAGLPLSICLLASIFAILYWFCLRKQAALPFDIGHFKQQYAQLGAWRYEEKMLAGVLTIAALLWFFRDDLVLGNFTISGWANLLPQPNYVQDSTVAILMAFALFFIPSKSKPARALCTWKEAQKLPYDIILLFGSGFAIAKGFEVSGLSTWLASQLTVLSQVPPFLMILGICALVTLMSEFASNVATIQLLLPVLAALSQSLNIDPLLLMLPATFAASLGFMLPVATAPNTIVFGTGKIPLPLMLRIGLLLDVVGIILITLFYS